MGVLMETMAIVCIQCGREFEFSVDEQIHYRKMNFDKPKRCPVCRKKKSKIIDFQDNRYNHKKKFPRFQE
ncbi:MAG: zinc-ribbon domain containing protein [Desulfobacterales bacterium]|nr:MAG: zinc-ribbon domain containing protein [Desulfobacterales bacterium]